jgi:hypothetical protein
MGMIAEDFQGKNKSRSGVVNKDPPFSKGIVTSLDGRVPISKLRIVGFSPLSVALIAPRGSIAIGPSSRLLPTLPFPLSYLDFMRKSGLF